MTFLEQLQQSAGLLSNDIASVGFYTPQQTDFIDGVAQNRFVGNQFQTPGLSLAPGQQIPVFGGTMGSGLLNYSPGSFTYTPQPFQSNYFQNVPMMLPNAQTQETSQMRGGGDNRDRFNEMQARNALRNEIAQYGFNIPDEEISKLPGLLGLVDTFVSNIDRQQRIDDIMKDVEASKPFGVNMFGLGTSYKGSSGIDRDPADFGTPTTGPSARDADLGKGNRSGGGGFGGDNTGGRDASGMGGTGGRRGGAGPN
tara:strand:+ start:28 stop:789 length:762 start_codon:yes stop_codon:yes gene_type:complete